MLRRYTNRPIHHRHQAIVLIALKLKFETVKPASRQVLLFRVLCTRPLVLTIDTNINFYCICETVCSIRELETQFSFLIWISNRSRL